MSGFPDFVHLTTNEYKRFLVIFTVVDQVRHVVGSCVAFSCHLHSNLTHMNFFLQILERAKKVCPPMDGEWVAKKIGRNLFCGGPSAR
jgi:hypothetical protein